jgi:TetR/AcrR family transcriptional regulator, transcriptional repressor for nem operon
MTHSRPGKRERLVNSASELLHRQGVASTTLAEVAQAADVPPGNVYYYFKTREELIRAVIDSHAEAVRTLLGSYERRPDPRERLKGLAHSWVDVAELVADHGCPIGSLSLELNKRGDGLGEAAGHLFRLMLDWAQEQFRALGRPDPRGDAVTLLGAVQGAALLANALRDPELLAVETQRLEAWIDTL